MFDATNYKTRREIELMEPAVKPGSWKNLERKARVKPALRRQRNNRLLVLYDVADVPKLIAAARDDKRLIYKHSIKG